MPSQRRSSFSAVATAEPPSTERVEDRIAIVGRTLNYALQKSFGLLGWVTETLFGVGQDSFYVIPDITDRQAGHFVEITFQTDSAVLAFGKVESSFGIELLHPLQRDCPSVGTRFVALVVIRQIGPWRRTPYVIGTISSAIGHQHTYRSSIDAPHNKTYTDYEM